MYVQCAHTHTLTHTCPKDLPRYIIYINNLSKYQWQRNRERYKRTCQDIQKINIFQNKYHKCVYVCVCVTHTHTLAYMVLIHVRGLVSLCMHAALQNAFLNANALQFLLIYAGWRFSAKRSLNCCQALETIRIRISSACLPATLSFLLCL